MQVVRFGSAVEFDGAVAEALMAREAEHNLMLGLISILKGDANFYGGDPYFGAVVDAGHVVVAGLMTPPHPVVVSLCEEEEALQILAADVRAFRPDTPGVNSLSPTAGLFASAWGELTGAEAKIELAERIYKLTKLVPPVGVAGRSRKIVQADAELLAQWNVDFAAEAVSFTPTSMDAARRDIEVRLAADPRERGMLVWEEDGEVVCMAGYGGPTPNSLRIAPVFTPSKHRRHGFAAACTAAACEWILGPAGKSFVTLFADIANLTSNGVYQRIGFEAVCEAEEWRFGRQTAQ